MGSRKNILDRERSGLLVVDVQERLWTVMREHQRLAERIETAIRGCRLLKVPVFLTEQYPQGLGPTIAPVSKALGRIEPLVKMTFSCCGLTELPAMLREKGVEQVILAGIETHVCVLQTALDLITDGFQVHLLTDAVSSRHLIDEQTALRRLSRQGVALSTVETALFELLTTARAPEFKEISKLIK
jgi:hypothetical protein